MTGQGRTSKSDHTAIDGAEFGALMAPLGMTEVTPHLAIAVSGGPDSMALAVLSQEWASARGGEVIGLIVNHGLRPEAGEEAHQVAGWLGDRGIKAQVLTWEGPKPVAGVQAAAREARYQLLIEECTSLKLDHLLLAHHQDDQAETFLLRLFRSSGIDGLACMAPMSHPDVGTSTDIQLLRPLLTLPKSRLIATARSRNVLWVEDPSNLSPKFTRVRLRRVLEELAGEGLTADRLSVTAGRMARAREALDITAQELVDHSVHFDRAGFCRVSLDELRRVPEEISLRALLTLLRWTGGSDSVIRLERAERLHAALVGPHDFGGGTLGGCRILTINRPEGPAILVCREVAAARHQLRLAPGSRADWDGRFQVAMASECDSPSFESVAVTTPLVRCLGDDGWRQISARVSDSAKAGVPAPARASLPALWDQSGVAAVPLMDYRRDGLAPVFGTFSTNFNSLVADI